MPRTLVKGVQPRLKIMNDWGLFAITHNTEAFGAQIATLLPDTAGKLWIQSAIILDYSPIGGNSLLPISPIFFGRFSRDANEDACRQRTRYVRPKVFS